MPQTETSHDGAPDFRWHLPSYTYPSRHTGHRPHRDRIQHRRHGVRVGGNRQALDQTRSAHLSLMTHVHSGTEPGSHRRRRRPFRRDARRDVTDPPFSSRLSSMMLHHHPSPPEGLPRPYPRRTWGRGSLPRDDPAVGSTTRGRPYERDRWGSNGSGPSEGSTSGPGLSAPGTDVGRRTQAGSLGRDRRETSLHGPRRPLQVLGLLGGVQARQGVPGVGRHGPAVPAQVGRRPGPGRDTLPRTGDRRRAGGPESRDSL